jgi:hypothetical protein
MEVSGKVKVVNATQEVSATFKKRELVVTTNEQYPQHISIEFSQDKCDLLNGLNIGQEVTVHINLRGREWVNPQGETKYFNQIQGWKVDKVQSEAPSFEPKQQNEIPINLENIEQDDSGLPF